MKINLLKLFCALIVLVTFAIFLANCKKNDEAKPTPTILSFTPASALPGSTVTITGTGFSIAAPDNLVKFNNEVASITSATATQIVTVVPPAATTGKISVTVGGNVATSATEFVVLEPAPTITSFSPTSGPAATTVTINGTHFSIITSDNVVKFNGTTASVSTATATQLTTAVPAGATTGKITVTINGLMANSPGDFVVFQPPTITSFSPLSGPTAATVAISGTNFSTTTTDNIVKFNGTTASVSAATATQLTTSVPAGTTTGKITVTVNGLTATSATDFTFLTTPEITSFSPSFCQTGTTPTVTITGANFGSSIGENAVEFNGVAAAVSAASATELTVTVPAGATSGKISVTVNAVTGQSATDFLIGCPDVIVTSITVSNLVGNVFNVAYELKNIGTIPLDLNNMFLQAYVSTTATSSGSVQGAGGFGDYGCCGNTEALLQPNEVRLKTQASINGGNNSIATYPYVVLSIVKSSGSQTECDIMNNELGKLIQ